MLRPLLTAAVLTLAAAPAAADLRRGELVLERPVMRASFGRAPNTAAYLTVRNTGGAPDRLLGASCACARRVEIHRHDTAGGVMRMRPLPAAAVPPRGRLTFAPGGELALMVLGLKAPVQAGAAVEVRLRFERAGAVTVPFRVAREIAPASHAH